MSRPLRTVRRALVVGLGGSGQAAAALLVDRGVETRVTDSRPAGQLREAVRALPDGVTTYLGGHPPDCLDGVELVITSPGVPPTAPILEQARAAGIPVMPEVEAAWLECPDVPLVAVTGSNGKSTVTVLAAEMLRAGGHQAVEGGNLGTPASELVLRGGFSSWVLEISSFQAELLTAMRPSVGIFLNLSEDHLERHPDLVSYRSAKQRLLAFQQEGDAAVLAADDPQIWATPTRARRLGFALHGGPEARLDGDWLVLGDKPLIRVDEVALAGRHNLANALAAALAARDLGVEPGAIATVLRTFQGLPHRHRMVVAANGVRWVDDSKATNVGATLAGLEGYPERSVHLILGGLGKGQDFGLLRDAVRRQGAAVYLIGRDGPAIGRSLEGTAPLVDSGTLEAATARAAEVARAGETVLLAPACASFDQFVDYRARGDAFAAEARQIASRQGSQQESQRDSASRPGTDRDQARKEDEPCR